MNFYALDYCHEAPAAEPELEPGYSWELWRPGAGGMVPRGAKPFPFAVWTLFHTLGIFYNRHYAILVIRDAAGRMIHHSVVTPGYFRFPFMAKDDLQIGDVWTCEEHRGKGLAVFAVKTISRLCRAPGRTIWYLVDVTNLPSIKAVLKAGYALRGEGSRHARAGVNVLGYYALEGSVSQ